MPTPGAATFITTGPNAAAQGLADANAFNRGTGNPYGRVPSSVSPQTAQANSIGGNLAQLSQLYSLATGMGAASGSGAAANLNTALPGATDALGNALNVSKSEVSGQLPPDVINLIQQQAAERGIATGTAGSPNNDAAMLRALGLTSLDLSNTGIGNLSRVIGSTPTGPQFNPASQLIDPGQQLEQQNFNAALAAAPDPTAAALTNVAALNAGRGSGGSLRLPGPSPLQASPTGPTYSNVSASGSDLTPPPYQGGVQNYGEQWQVDPITGLLTNVLTGEINWNASGFTPPADNTGANSSDIPE